MNEFINEQNREYLERLARREKTNIVSHLLNLTISPTCFWEVVEVAKASLANQKVVVGKLAQQEQEVFDNDC